jgi:hypothetical protein
MQPTKTIRVHITGHVKMAADSQVTLEVPANATEDEIRAVIEDLAPEMEWENAEGGPEDGAYVDPDDEMEIEPSTDDPDYTFVRDRSGKMKQVK